MLTKADLAPDADATAAQLRRRLGLDEALAISVRSGDGLPALRSLLAPEATTALLGASGAGKSTLVNTLLGEERQATAPVREKDGLGRHTTVTRELIELPGGALLLDTPGLREVGLWVDAGAAFDDIDRLAASCRFGDCAHRERAGLRGARGRRPRIASPPGTGWRTSAPASTPAAATSRSIRILLGRSFSILIFQVLEYGMKLR